MVRFQEKAGDKDHAIKQTAMNYVGSDEEEANAKKKSVCDKMGLFYSAPVTKFWLTTLLFCVFLLIYTYFVLGELPADQIPWIEIVLACFVVSITTEEIRQVLTESGSFAKKMHGYFTSIWNWMDVFGVVLFWIAFGMRFIPNNDWKDIARMFYILDIFFWYMRLLNIFTINKRLGPLITIILTMIPELLRFFFIWILFMIAFGVITKSVATPIRYGQVTALDMIKVVDMSYWQTYGELFLEDLDDDAAMKPGTDCTNDYTDDTGLPPCPFLPHTSVVFTAIYMVVGNILLMNLLIALFTSIYEQVNEKSTTDWKNKRLDVIVEYHTRPPFPPPFTILYHLILLFRWPSHKEDVKKSKGLTLDVSTSRMYELLLFEEEVKEEYLIEQFSKEGIDLNKQVATLAKNFEKNDKLMKENMAHLANESAKTNKKLDEIEQLLRTLIEKQQ
ncbi:transient receptor potential cation channel subfamily M member-like 2 isoform X2 [Convolutriloba macropyga]|uniref:transient receptor potential cation channel subfamily M member-like 2 isoform X2 n=1 Tax=Convolutriloba macropyga TaxID=536237 RepID=UPI003F51F1DB